MMKKKKQKLQRKKGKKDEKKRQRKEEAKGEGGNKSLSREDKRNRALRHGFVSTESRYKKDKQDLFSLAFSFSLLVSPSFLAFEEKDAKKHGEETAVKEQNLTESNRNSLR